MTILWINLAIVFIFSFFARYFSSPATLIPYPSSTHILIKPNRLLMFLAMLTLVLVSGLRSNIGDTFFYKHIYEINDFTWDFILSQKDIGFGILQKILKMYSDDPQIMIFTTALITNVLIVLILFKYSRIFELSLYVYITGGLFLISMNGIRQLFAASIIFTATKYLIEGNWKKYVLIVLFASTFHQSALILIPIYFLARTKAWSKATVLLIFLSIAITLVFDQFSAFLFSSIKDTQYGQYENFAEGGANIIRVAVNAAPVIIAFIGRKKLKEIYPKSDYIVNMSIIGLVFMIISTQNWIFARFSIYFDLYLLLLISWIVKLFRKQDEMFVYYGLLICYGAYYFFENVISLHTVYKSDFLSW
ncbi:EpsG family protein [Fictibacillus barbaricus]|uniref:Transmembrane protein EpsG n=1 Tax=Fictibacillus barbaricus TaxID=182136 RepID=A0ABU1U1T2_9BACL|nr:EpsG family protein [Fictibacillus barbaricus]MDR7073370.1 transmembrane protein EpsG [Fictibacillus barbaricus]